MSDRAASIPVLVLAAAIIALALYGTLSARNDDREPRKGNEMDRLEDAIILEGLEMNTEHPPESEEDVQGGMILYDEEFIVKGETPDDRDAQKDPAGSTDSLLADLKKKDARWHEAAYTIRRGDNLWSIAQKFGTDHRLIIRINDISNPDSLRPGKKIKVPSRYGVYYTVRKGDTLGAIAVRYRTSADTISVHNEISALIKPGMKIFLPGGTAPVVKQAAENRVRTSVASQTVGKNTSRMAFDWPVRGRITSTFGNRRDPFTKTRKFHCGIDISLDPGTPIKAAADGTVIFSGWKEGYGNVVVIRHKNAYISVYAHNKSNAVGEGDEVKRGQEIALSGMTGLVTGAHLHFEIRKYLTPLNPLRFLR